MSDKLINELYFVQQLNCDKKFISILPKFKDYVNDGNFGIKQSGELLMYCITNDDNVYVYDCIDGQYINDVNKNYVSEPQKVEELCQKQVINIICGIYFTIALTKTGRIYTWGQNTCGQLGHGNTNNDYLKPTLINSLIDKYVIDIKCGACHCLALTRNGEVYEWGKIAVTHEKRTIPYQVLGLQFQTIISIACGLLHSLVLTDNGDVFSWGLNNYGQLGIGSYTDTCNPIKIESLNVEKIIKINCGAYHSMLLSENGHIYVFGSNNCAQIGDGSNENKNIPFKLNIDTIFVDMCSPVHILYYIYTGLSVDGFCYVWGLHGESLITTPTKTQYKDIDEVLMKYSRFKMTYKPYYFKKTLEDMSPKERFEETFNKQDFRLNDITFKIDGKYIYVQKSYLISVCQHFDTLFSNQWIESTNIEIEITQYSYSVCYAFLKYLYTNSVEIQSKDLIDLYHLSDSYFEENLKKKCIEIMKEVVNINNVINFYVFSVNNNFKELENHLFDYMKLRMKDVIKSEAYNQLNDISIPKRLFETLVNTVTHS